MWKLLYDFCILLRLKSEHNNMTHFCFLVAWQYLTLRTVFFCFYKYPTVAYLKVRNLYLWLMKQIKLQLAICPNKTSVSTLNFEHNINSLAAHNQQHLLYGGTWKYYFLQFISTSGCLLVTLAMTAYVSNITTAENNNL